MNHKDECTLHSIYSILEFANENNQKLILELLERFLYENHDDISRSFTVLLNEKNKD